MISFLLLLLLSLLPGGGPLPQLGHDRQVPALLLVLSLRLFGRRVLLQFGATLKKEEKKRKKHIKLIARKLLLSFFLTSEKPLVSLASICSWHLSSFVFVAWQKKRDLD
jgi:uncharacterized membrane protein